MMEIQSIKTGLPHQIPKEQWDAMKADGRSRLYKIIKKAAAAAPTELQPTYAELVTVAEGHIKDNSYREALEFYTQADALNSSNKTRRKIADLKKLIDKD